MLKKSPFFNFLNRRKNTDFQGYLNTFDEDKDYIEWNGYLLPNDYGDAVAEYRAIRQQCAMFDVTPLRKYRIRGSGSGAFLDRLLTRPASPAPSMTGIYVVFCNEDGSLKDDAILHKYDEDDYLLLPSDMDHSAHFAQIQEQFALEKVTITDCTDDWVGFALQGPRAATVMKQLGLENIEHLRPFEIKDFPLAEGSMRVARMGFTADLGYECWFKPELRPAVEQQIDRARTSLGLEIPGYGLTALESCRLEGGFIVAGWDCATEVDPQPGFERNPYELGLGWLVDLQSSDFVGQQALRAQQEAGHRYTIRSYLMDDQAGVDAGDTIYAKIDGNEVSVGSINCIAWSATLMKSIGNASIHSAHAGTATAWVKNDSGRFLMELKKPPLLKLEHARADPARLV